MMSGDGHFADLSMAVEHGPDNRVKADLRKQMTPYKCRRSSDPQRVREAPGCLDQVTLLCDQSGMGAIGDTQLHQDIADM